jgi:uncharacterized protein with HEPN domain
MKETDIVRLRHMLEAAREIRSFIKERNKDDLERDRILTLALVKEIEIIGEAASKVSQEARQQIPDIEWRDIVGMRNRLVHVYFEIDEDILWDTIIYDIPKLIEELNKLPDL